MSEDQDTHNPIKPLTAIDLTLFEELFNTDTEHYIVQHELTHIDYNDQTYDTKILDTLPVDDNFSCEISSKPTGCHELN